jgi:hypothetical protein
MATRAEFRARAASRDQRLLTGLRRRLGHARVIGGLTYLERASYGDDTMGVLLELSPPGRKEGFALMARMLDKARVQPPCMWRRRRVGGSRCSGLTM